MIRKKYIMSVVTVALVLTACGSKSKGDADGVRATVVVRSDFEPKGEAGATSGGKITIANITWPIDGADIPSIVRAACDRTAKEVKVSHHETLVKATWDESVMVPGPDGTHTAAPRYNADIVLNAAQASIAIECYEPIY